MVRGRVGDVCATSYEPERRGAYRCATAQTDGGQTSERQPVRRRSNANRAMVSVGIRLGIAARTSRGRSVSRRPPGPASPSARRRPDPVAEFDPHPLQEFDPYPVSELDQEAWDEVVQVCGFFGPRNVRRTEQEVRDAIVARARAEWTAWHNGAAPVAESDATRFGRLVGYSLAANADIDPDHLTALQTAALGTINYAPLLGASNTVAGVQAALITAAAVPDTPTMRARVATALTSARQANKDSGTFKSWSAVFVVGCVRGAAIGLGLEAIIGTEQAAVIGKNELLLATIRHSEYTREARIRRAARTTGTYQAFTPAERVPQRGDIIVQDRRPNTPSGHDAGESAGAARDARRHRRRRAADVRRNNRRESDGARTRCRSATAAASADIQRNAQGFLVVDRQQLFAQEDDTGALAALPLTSTEPLHTHSTRRIFAVLSLAEECRAPRNFPYPASSLA